MLNRYQLVYYVVDVEISLTTVVLIGSFATGIAPVRTHANITCVAISPLFLVLFHMGIYMVDIHFYFNTAKIIKIQT